MRRRDDPSAGTPAMMALLLATIGCAAEGEGASLDVFVDTDLTEVAALRITFEEPGAPAQLSPERLELREGSAQLPAYFHYESTSPSVAVIAEALGPEGERLGDERVLVRRSMRLQADHGRHVLRIFLTSDCVSVACPEAQSCAASGCVDEVIVPSELPINWDEATGGAGS